MRLVCKVPAKIRRIINSQISKKDKILILVKSDIKDHHSFGDKWIAVTKKKIIIITPLDNKQFDTAAMLIKNIKNIRIENLIGYNSIIIGRKRRKPVVIYYSNFLSHQFAEVVKGIQQLIDKKPFQIKKSVAPIRCKKCGRLLENKEATCIYCFSKGKIILRIMKLLKPYRFRVLWLIILTLLVTLIQLVPPHFTKILIDKVLTPKQNIDLFIWLVMGILLAAIISTASNIIRSRLASWMGGKITQNLRQQLFHHMAMLHLKFYDKKPVGNIISRVTHDTEMLYIFLIEGVPFVLTNLLMLITISIILFSYNWQLALYTIIPVPFIFFGGMLFWKIIRRLAHRWMARWSVFTANLNETISGIRVVKAFAKETKEMEKFDREATELFRATFQVDKIYFSFFPAMTFFTTLGLIIVWYMGGKKVLAGALTLGTLMAFISYLSMFYWPLQWMAQMFNWMSRAITGAERIFEIMNIAPEQFASKKAIPMPHIKGNIKFQNVNFGYEVGQTVLKNISINIKSGEMVGLVGKSGVGKTTLINLVCKFYEADSGKIYIDGKDIKEIRLKDLRSQIGYVLQEPFLFNGTIAENITYGKEKSTIDEIIQAARAANAHDFILAKPDGYNTRVGERGSKLSVGEKQRISIARAILHNPRILILDEATSSVDTETETKIQEAIQTLVKNRTTFAIAHRLSTLRNASKLIILENGKITEMGTHDKLLKKKGIYYNMLHTQRKISKIKAIG